MCELDQRNESELLNLTAALENNTVVSLVDLDVSGFTKESANTMGKFLWASNNLREVVLVRSMPGQLQQHRFILYILL
jgi:hypothetical protein